MADKLVIVEEKYRFRIQWELEEDPGMGAYLVQSMKDGLGKPPTDREEWEHWAASSAVRTTEGVMFDDCSAYWESLKLAKAALRVAKAALKQERPLPDWAKKALEAGWKAPKGWKA